MKVKSYVSPLVFWTIVEKIALNPDKDFISYKLRKLYKERDKYIEYSDNDRKEGLIPWGCEIAIIQIENEIKELEKLLTTN